MYQKTKYLKNITILLIIISLLLSTFFPIIEANSNHKIEINIKNSEKSIKQDLPDLKFLNLKIWWGRTNTTGIFVDYDIINDGATYYSDDPISSNLSFFIYENNSQIGYINQTPIFYPSIWYEKEILGGNQFFKMTKKPEKITVKIDYTNLIKESNENNNNQTVTVLKGITITGKIRIEENGEIKPINNIIELNEFNNYSLSTYGYRHFYSNENGSYNISICPKEPIKKPQKYYIMAKNLENTNILINETKPLIEGENISIDLIFSGVPPEKPKKPFGRKIGKTNRTYQFFTSNNDKDQDNISYKFDWGDGNYSKWLGPFPTNEIIIANHSWEKKESYTIKVISKDNKSMLGTWSDPLTINIPEKEFYTQFLFTIIHYIIEKK